MNSAHDELEPTSDAMAMMRWFVHRAEAHAVMHEELIAFNLGRSHGTRSGDTRDASRVAHHTECARIERERAAAWKRAMENFGARYGASVSGGGSNAS